MEFKLVSYEEDFYFNVDHLKRGCYYNDGNAGGCDSSNDTFENRWYFNVDNFEDCYYNVDHFKSGCYFNDGNAGGCYFTDGYKEDGFFTVAKE